MILDPANLTTAVRHLLSLNVMPTSMSTNELRGVDKAIRAKSLFSARTMEMAYIDEIRSTLGTLLSGETNMASARQLLQEKLDQLGYNPARHFNRPDESRIPPADAGGLRDLSSDQRVDLVLNTNLRMIANAGEEIDGNDPDALREFPCWELVRFYDRDVPRGFERRKGGLVPVLGDSWQERWVRAGGKLYDGRMIARRDAPVWSALGDSGVFSDGTDSDVAPYAFNSGYDRIARSRAECISLGVIGPEDEVRPRDGLPSLMPALEPETAPLADLAATRDALLAAAKKWRQS
jgi:hypothetical protein